MSVLSDNVVIRPVQATDRAAIEAISAQIWEGHDYLPKLIDRWLADTYGTFDVMELDGVVVGVSKLSRYSEGEWWLEGLRIDPSQQGKGLARIFHHYKVNQAQAIGAGVLRFSTTSENKAVHKLAEETGFTEIARLVYAQASAEPAMEASYFHQLSVEDEARVQAWLDASPYFAAVDRSFEYSWKWQYATADYIRDFLADGRVYAWDMPGGDPIEGLVFLHPSTTDKLSLAYGDTYAEHRPVFWDAVRGLAHQLGYANVDVKLLYETNYIMPHWDYEDWQIFLYSRVLHSDNG